MFRRISGQCKSQFRFRDQFTVDESLSPDLANITAVFHHFRDHPQLVAGNDRPTMPFCVLGETLLQPCGWLASYSGFALSGTDRG